MRSAVTPAALPSAPPTSASPTTTFGRRVRALRIALAVALAVAVPLVVALAAQQGRAGTQEAYREQARTDATAVAALAAEAPRATLGAELERIRRANSDVRGIA